MRCVTLSLTRVLMLLAVALAIALASAVAPGISSAALKEQTASTRGTVDAGDRHVTRLRRLPAGATLQVEIETGGALRVLLVDQGDLAGASDRARPLFSGRTGSEISFDLTIPRSSTYLLVLDNRDGSAAQQFSLSVRASFEADATGGVGMDEMLRELDKLEAGLRQLLAFDGLDFRVGSCGLANAFNTGDTIILCAEISEVIQERVNHPATARDVILFVTMHEIGHALLRQWNFPGYRDEDVADEFATVLLLMSGHKDRIESMADFFDSFDPIAEAEKLRGRDSRHPLSTTRADNLRRWVEDPDLVRRWQSFLVQHMQTRALEILARRPTSWADVSAVEEELARR